MYTDPEVAKGRFFAGLVLQWVKRPPDGALLVAEFENKVNPSEPYMVERPAIASELQFVVKSPWTERLYLKHKLRVSPWRRNGLQR